MTTTVLVQALVTLSPLVLALVAWARLGPDRSRVAQEALGDALEQLRADRDDMRSELVEMREEVALCRQRVTVLEAQLRTAGLEPAQ